MKVSIKQILTEGIRSVYYNKRIIVLLWITNAVSAFILSLPIYYLFSQELSHSTISDKLANGFDYQWFMQFETLFKMYIGQIPFMIYTVVIIYTLIQTFYFAGLIAVFNNSKKNHIVDFFYGGVKYWFRFLKIMIISLIFYAFAFLLNDGLGNLISYIFKGTENEFADFIIRSARYLLLLFLIGLVAIISDYSKVGSAIDDESKSIKYIGKSIKFIKNNFFLVFTVFISVSSIGALGAVVYNAVERFIPRTPFYFLAAAFILQQMLIIFRLYIRMLFCATEVYLFKDLSEDIIEVETVE